MKKLIVRLTPLTFALCLWAAQTRTWVETDYSDFERGVIKNLSLRSDGRLTLAPRFEELFDSPSAYLWALARDSKGNLYAGGGPDAKLFRISPSGEKKTLAEFQALEIHAIAVDHKDRIFVATSPDGKVYRVNPDGKSDLFFDPKAKYIWALAFDKGDLLVATGIPGVIHRVTPDGKGTPFFKTDETHVRSMTLDGKGNVIIGTEPDGLVIRVSPAGEGFVLYEMNKREVTAVATALDGSVYAAAVGSKLGLLLAPPPPQPISSPQPQMPGGQPGINPHGASSPTMPSLGGGSALSVAGGSEVFRIHPDGYPEKIWSHPQDLVYAIAFDSSGHALLGTGNKGYIYRIDSDTLHTALVNAPPTQVTVLLPAAGRLYAVTGNVGKVYAIGPGFEHEGSIESDVFDAGMFSLWGRLSFKGGADGGRIAIQTRSGNLDRPQTNWSAWSSEITSEDGVRVTSPPARFLQWRATLTSDAADKIGRSPEVEEVKVAYLSRNVAPRVEEIEITPPNYKFPVQPAGIIAPQTLSLPPLGKPARPPVSLGLETTTPPMQAAKGSIGARWNAVDDNGDALISNVEIRGTKETQWKLLKDKLKDKYLSWDSTSFADGEYVLRVTTSDLPGNTPQDALTGSLESDPFTIDNTPPRITALISSRNGTSIEVRWHAADALNVISKAEYSLDGGDWTVVNPAAKLSDSKELDYILTLNNVPAGEHTVAVRIADEYDNQTTDKVVAK